MRTNAEKKAIDRKLRARQRACQTNKQDREQAREIKKSEPERA